jgi:(p)ppGpp synthase/HD superfamily hydrolase
LHPLTRALDCAIEWHGDQLRKGTPTPYVAHLLAVTAIVLETGGTLELHAPAAMLHDAVEDTLATLEQIERQFGRAVRDIVEGCSDAHDPTNKAPWEQRKQSYVRHLWEASPDVLIVSLADKLHNCTSIVEDYRREGPKLWTDRFKRGAAHQLWYYWTLVQVYESRRADLAVDACGVLDRLVRAVDTLAELIGNWEPDALEAAEMLVAKFAAS